MTAKVEINWKVLDALLQFKVTLKFCAEYMQVSTDSIQRRCKQEKGMTFEEYHESRISRTATKLQQKALEMALNGDRTMLIFCLKNLAGWSDKQEIKHNLDNNYESQLRKLEEDYERGKQTIEAEFKKGRVEHKRIKGLDVGMEDEQNGLKEIGSLPDEISGAPNGQEGDN